MKVEHRPATFGFDQNRSERALQAHLLAPTLASTRCRVALLTGLDTNGDPVITEAEASSATAMHFVWVLRDAFTSDRDATSKSRDWEEFVQRWCAILDLPRWAHDLRWWRHPNGSYKGDDDFVVHPCHRTIGWTRPGIHKRVEQLGLGQPTEADLAVLEQARKVLNTESDCFVQTPQRLIIVECKDKTGFSTEQRERQQQLGDALVRLLARPMGVLHVEVAPTGKTPNRWTWPQLEALLAGP